MDVLTEQELAIPGSKARGVIPGMLVSFALAMALGVVSGTLMGLYRRCEQTLDLWVMVGLTIPSLCYIIVSFLWLGLSTIARRCWLSPGQPFLLSPSTSGRA
ncbi:MAG: hypothetical protein HYV01_16655 [Deltaproteobacteria bacterium]|nr:hypothetical protein [Deltaproteobacteria bacterium]